MKKKLVVKIGTSTLTAGSNRISYAKIEDLARQMLVLSDQYDIIIVSSGAIAAAKQFVDISKHHTYVNSKQAMAAIGQPKLMRLYDEVFGNFGLPVAQCLLTYTDFKNDIARQNTKNTIDKLLEYRYIPIINENDTVATDEIELGDNDKLSALVAGIVGADLLVIASDIDGLYDGNPHIKPDAKLISMVTNIDDIKIYAQEKESIHGTGGMTSKLNAAEICKNNRVPMWIVNGGIKNFIVLALNNEIPCTKFVFDT